jgi:hypothetical protein
MALFQGSLPHWRSWGSFLYSVQTGKPAFEYVHGQSFFDYCQTDDEFASAFNGAMTGMSRRVAEAIVEAYDFSTINKLVDVGGGHGHLLASILRKYPHMQGVVFDLPGVVSGAQATINDAELNGRCEAIGGSFFESVPAGDAYIAKHIIHDWDDEHSLRILRNMREAAIGRSRVLLVEVVVGTENPEPFAALMDLEMLQATHGGRERTAAEFNALLAGAGWQLERIIPTKSLVSVLEAFAR